MPTDSSAATAPPTLDGLRGMASIALHEALDKIDSDPLAAALAAGLAKSCLAIEASNKSRKVKEAKPDAAK